MANLTSTQRQRRLFRRFIVVSIALHVAGAAAFFLPDYLRKLRNHLEVTDTREMDRHRGEQKRIDEAKAATDSKKRVADAAARQAKQEIAEQLHEQFQAVVGDQLKGADVDQMWADILAQMTAGLDGYSREVADGNADEGDLQQGLTDLQAKILEQLAEQLRQKSKKELADAFIARVQNDVSPKLIEYYRHQLSVKIGDALRDEGTKIVKDDVAEIRDKRKAVTVALAAAGKQAGSAVSDLTAARKKVEMVEKLAEGVRIGGKNDVADAKIADAVRDAQATVERSGKAVEEAAGHLRDAAKGADVMNIDTNRAIHAALDDIDRTTKDIAKAADDAHTGKPIDFEKSQGKAADSATQLAEAIKLAAGNAYNDRDETSLAARSAIKHARDEDLKQLIERAFWENYGKKSAPRLGAKLAGVFKQTLEQGGIKDDTLVADVDKRVTDALINEVRDKIHAGEAGTGPLSRVLKLDEIADAPGGPHGNDAGNHGGAEGAHHAGGTAQANGDGANSATRQASDDAAGHGNLREQAIADRIGKTARDLVHANIEGIGDDDGGDEAAVKAASPVAKGKRGKGDADENADADGLAGLAERVGRLAGNVKDGRTDLADAATAAAGSGAGANGAGASGPAGAGKPHLPGEHEHLHGALLRHHGRLTDEAAYAKLTADIHDRDHLAARGQATTRKSADGQIVTLAATDAAQAVLRPAVVLVPGDSKIEPIGQPEKAEPFVPKFKSIRFAAIPYRAKPVVIDGDLSEWKDVPELSMTPSHETEAKGSKLKQFPQAVKVQWDNTGFYLAYDVKDADDKITKVKATDFWEGDGIEFWVDTLNTKEKARTQCTHQFWAWVNGAVDNPAYVGGEAQSWPGRDEYLPLGADVIKTASKKTDAGWTIEVFVPASKFRMLDLQPGRILGMNFSICTGTDLYYYWAGTTKVSTARRPDTWGDVLLAGSAGRLECLDKLTSELAPNESPKPLNAVRIGESLRIRVTDPDMNLSDTERDRVAVSVSTGRGERQTLILEETANATGIFEGVLRTTLDTGTSPDGVLPLLDGDQIAITYIDQCRPDGSRDVPVRLMLPTASSITRLTQK